MYNHSPNKSTQASKNKFVLPARIMLPLHNYSTQSLGMCIVLLQFAAPIGKHDTRMHLETKQVPVLRTQQLHMIIVRSSKQADVTQGCS